MKNNKMLVLVCACNDQAEKVVNDLERLEIDSKDISIVGKQACSEEEFLGYYYHAGAMELEDAGIFWEGIWRHLSGSAFFYIPGIGSLLIAGPFVSTLLFALNIPFGLSEQSALGIALIKEGVPAEEIGSHETDVRNGKFLILVQGDQVKLDQVNDSFCLQFQVNDHA